MKQFCIVTDTKRCISCQACVAHCKTKNDVPAGVFLGTLVTSGPSMDGGACVLTSEYQACYSCERAWCMEACPSGAIHRDDDGTVWIDEQACIGCALCAHACPWHMPHMVKIAGENTKTKRLAIKCDHCRDLRSEGLQPACVTACSTHALQYMPLCDAPEAFQQAYATRMAEVAPAADAFVAKLVVKRARNVKVRDVKG